MDGLRGALPEQTIGFVENGIGRGGVVTPGVVTFVEGGDELLIGLEASRWQWFGLSAPGLVAVAAGAWYLLRANRQIK